MTLHHSFNVEPYGQRILFAVDADPDSVQEWLRHETKLETYEIPEDHRQSNSHAWAYELRDLKHGLSYFVIWLKAWDGGVYHQARLAHECLHAAISILQFVGWTPKMKGKHSEPLAYLLELIVRECLIGLANYGKQKKR